MHTLTWVLFVQARWNFKAKPSFQVALLSDISLGGGILVGTIASSPRTSVSMDQLPAQTIIMGRGSILGLVFALFIASVQAKINNDCHLVDDDGSAVGDISKYSGRNETTGWVGEPDTRGSMTIVTTCLVTLGLCVWTSIHVNVQIDRLSFYRLRRKVATSVKALIFPNLVVESAQGEWAEMTRLYEGCANLKKIMDEFENTPKPVVPPVEKPKDAARQEESEKDPIEIASPISEATTYSSTSPEPAQSTPINMSPDAASQGSSNGGSPKSTWFKRVIGMAEKPEDPDYPFSKEVCFFVVMGGFVRPGRENALPTASGHATAPQSHQMPPPANETLTKRKQKKLANANEKLDKAKEELDNAKAELNNINSNTNAEAKVRSKAERKLAKAEARLAQARAKLAKARLPMFKITPEDFFNAYARNPDKFRRLIKSREKDILDKGNASNIAKLIIMAQVTKLVLQMIGRKAMKLSVAVLELHIFCHILIAGLLYSYWWYKQLDVNEPMVLDIGDRYFAPDPMWSHFPERALPPTLSVSWQRFWKRFDPLVWFGIEKLATDAMAKEEKAMALALTIKQINAMRFEGKAGVLEPPAPRLAVPKTSETDKNTRTPHRRGTSYFPPKHARPECEPFRKSLLTKAKFESNRRAMWFYIAYGGLHATVWGRENFPTWQEKWLWRTACIAVAVVPAVGAASEYIRYLWSLRNRTDEENNPGGSKGETQQDATDPTDKEKLKRFTRDWFRGLLTLKYLLEFAYLLASVTLLSESFAILRAEDARTYEIKSWTAELPLGR